MTTTVLKHTMEREGLCAQYTQLLDRASLCAQLSAVIKSVIVCQTTQWPDLMSSDTPHTVNQWGQESVPDRHHVVKGTSLPSAIRWRPRTETHEPVQNIPHPNDSMLLLVPTSSWLSPYAKHISSNPGPSPPEPQASDLRCPLSLLCGMSWGDTNKDLFSPQIGPWRENKESITSLT